MKQQNLIVAVGLLLAAAVPAAAAPPPAVVTEEAMVPSGDPGIDIYVRKGGTWKIVSVQITRLAPSAPPSPESVT